MYGRIDVETLVSLLIRSCSRSLRLIRDYSCTRFWPLRAAARSTPERGGTSATSRISKHLQHLLVVQY